MDTETDMETEMDMEAETDMSKESDIEMETYMETETDIETETDMEMETDMETETNMETEPDNARIRTWTWNCGTFVKYLIQHNSPYSTVWIASDISRRNFHGAKHFCAFS
jgi:frataxin-like iron-binding protein CyaY